MNSVTHKKLEKLLANTGDMALKRRARRIIEEIDPQSGDKILEVGCGDGFYLHILSSLGIKKLFLTGCDVDKNALKSARRNLKGRKIKLLQADLMKKLPFRTKLFNKIIMSEVCEHLPDDVKGLREVKRVMKKGGSLVVTVPNANYPLLWDPVNWVLERLFRTHVRNGFWSGIWNQHLRLYKLEEIKKVVKRAGFDVKKVESLTFWCIPFNHNIMNFMARQLYGGNLDERTSIAVSKFTDKRVKKPLLINLIFIILNSIDKLNNFSNFSDVGVGLLVFSEK